MSHLPQHSRPKRRSFRPLRVGVGGPVGSGKDDAGGNALQGDARANTTSSSSPTTSTPRKTSDCSPSPVRLRPSASWVLETGGCPHTAIREDAVHQPRSGGPHVEASSPTPTSCSSSRAATTSRRPSSPPNCRTSRFYVIGRRSRREDSAQGRPPASPRATSSSSTRPDLAPYVGADLGVMEARHPSACGGTKAFRDDETSRTHTGLADVVAFIERKGLLET